MRKIVQINEELCNGCGQCIINCAEGALQIVDGKARLLSDNYCDGLGACLGHCPLEAIRIVKREAKTFDEKAVQVHLRNQKGLDYEYPSEIVHSLNTATPQPSSKESSLRHWPVHLNLVPLKASFFDDTDLLIIANCVPIAYPDLHGSLLHGKSVVIGCPKFDDAQSHAEKLGEILKRNKVKSVTVAHMEVPCCSGLAWIVRRAIESSGKQIPIKQYVITIKGETK